MNRRHLLTRALTVGALAAATLGIAAPAAHAAAPLPTFDTKLSCDPGQPGANPFAKWVINVANPVGAPATAVFTIKVDGNAPEDLPVPPGGKMTFIRQGFDGIPTHLTVAVNGTSHDDEFGTVACNLPSYNIEFFCNAGGPQNKDAVVRYSMEYWGNKPHTWAVHQSDGSVYAGFPGGTMSYSDPVAEDKPYDVWIEIDGQKVVEKQGTTNCVTDKKVPAPPTSTTTTTVPNTATTVATATHDDPPAVAPTTTVAAATAAQTLPFTGSSSLPLGMIGFTLLGGGGVALLLARRRTQDA